MSDPKETTLTEEVSALTSVISLIGNLLQSGSARVTLGECTITTDDDRPFITVKNISIVSEGRHPQGSEPVPVKL